MAGEIRLLKLVNGDDILSEVFEANRAVELKNPVKIMVVPNKADPRNPQVAFIPWVQFTKDTTFTLDTRHVLVIMEPMDEMLKQYKQLFSKIILDTKLVLPTKGN